MTGSSAMAITAAGPILGYQQLQATTASLFTSGSSALTGAGVLSGVVANTSSPVAALTGVGVLAGPVVLTIEVTTQTTGGVALAGTVVLTTVIVASPTATGVLAGTTALEFTPTGTLLAAASLTGTVVLSFDSAGNLRDSSIVHGIPLDWSGRTNVVIAWKGTYLSNWLAYPGSDNMQQYRFPVRVNVPQELNYVFRSSRQQVIDLSDCLSVSVEIKKDGAAYATTVADFGDRTAGQVTYDGYQFTSAGEWSVQFVALMSSGKPLYGEPVRVKVVRNVDGLGTNELPEY